MSIYFDIRLPADARRTIAWKQIVRRLHPWLANAQSVLEIGAGRCSFINEVSAPRRVAIDIDPETKTLAAKDVEVLLMDAQDVHTLTETFDLILASNFFEHLTDEQFATLLPRLIQRLNPKGRLIIMQPNFRYAFREYFDDYTHKKIFNDVGLADALVAQGMRVVYAKPKFLPYSLKQSPSFAPAFLVHLGVWCYLRSPWRPCAGQMVIIAEKI